MKYAMILYGSVLAAISFRKTALKFEPIKGLRILILIMQALLAHQITIPYRIYSDTNLYSEFNELFILKNPGLKLLSPVEFFLTFLLHAFPVVTKS